MDKVLYADIILDLNTGALDRSFQYRIPSELRQKVVCGSKVNIPFGNGNRMITGYVVGISDSLKWAAEKIKDIDSVVEKELSIDDRMVELAFWMKEHYGSTANEALKCVIPVKKVVKKQLKRIIVPLSPPEVLKDEAEKAAKKHYVARERLLRELVLEYGSGLKYELVTEKLNISSSVINYMEKSGLIRIESVELSRNGLGKGSCEAFKEKDVILNEEQKNISESIISDIRNGINANYLIFGITGSGKTEVYLSVIDEVIRRGKSVIMLIPEIALTYQTVKRFYKRFGDSISVINSRLSAGERYDRYLSAKSGETKIVIGPRSAVFTPFDNLGLIIMDEEHESSYKSENAPRYSTREVALWRAGAEGASVILGSATPSLESYSMAMDGRVRLFELKERAGGALLPKVYIEDLRNELKAGNRSIFSRRLKELMALSLEKKEQIMLFINRRGHSGFVNCRSCGYVIKCPHCDVSLTYHNNGKLVCHYCGYETDMVQNCPECGSSYIKAFGTGTQKVEELLQKEFPSARILRMDYDTTRLKESYDKILSGFSNHEADILVGTQMIVKGHDFPGVTLVGVLLADMSLYAEDFRSAERTYELLAQAVGRAGRGMARGSAVIQTYNPEHYAITAAAAHDYKGFYDEEIVFRKLMDYPPAWEMLKIVLSSKDEELLYKETEKTGALLRSITGFGNGDEKSGLRLFGPSKALVYKVNDVYRMAFYIKGDGYEKLKRIKDRIAACQESSDRNVSVQFDFNPV